MYRKIAVGSLAFVAVLLTVVLIPVSIVVIENDEMALVYHNISKEFDRGQTPLEQGRYALQPGQHVFRFKRVYVLHQLTGEDHAVQCVSADGLNLRLDITFQYRLQKDHLVDMFLEFGRGYEPVIVLRARAAILDSCGEWTATDFYYNRQAVQTDMLIAVDRNLELLYCDGGFLQLINVQFDTDFMNSLQNTQAAIQEISQALNERNQELIKAQTEVLRAQQWAAFTSTNANAEAQVVAAAAVAQAMSINTTLKAQTEAYSGITDALRLDGSGLINYIALQTMQGSGSLTVSVKSPAKFSYT
ncbi:SPFH/Band 7/PHB domain protein [uncultured virus]|nr:SPFH/Band 7/PHB domain protein [uncultured virus]